MKLSLAHLVLSSEELGDFKRPKFTREVKAEITSSAERNAKGRIICSLCGEVAHKDFNINHKIPWADIRHQALNDPELLTLPRAERKRALSDLFNQPDNLEITHPRCNQRHAHRLANERHTQRLNAEKTR